MATDVMLSFLVPAAIRYGQILYVRSYPCNNYFAKPFNFQLLRPRTDAPRPATGDLTADPRNPIPLRGPLRRYEPRIRSKEATTAVLPNNSLANDWAALRPLPIP